MLTSMQYKLILASASPRRKQLLEQMGVEFEIWPSRCEEITKQTKPALICEELSSQKALDVASAIKTYNQSHPDIASDQNIIVIGADTIVADGDMVLGKPLDEEDAKRMLKLLEGKSHKVYTGVTLVFMSADGRVGEYSFHEETDVILYPISDEEIDEYVTSGEPLDKAGAYGIQGSFAKFVKKIDGDYNNVVGLPTSRLYFEMKQLLG